MYDNQIWQAGDPKKFCASHSTQFCLIFFKQKKKMQAFQFKTLFLLLYFFYPFEQLLTQSMDIQNIPPISADQHRTHYAETPSSNIHNHLPTTSSASTTHPHTSMTLSSSTSSSSSSLVAEPSLATIHEYESPSTTNSFADDADYLPPAPPPPPTTTITMPDDDPVIGGANNDLLPLDMNPAFLLGNHRFDKRKSSPAILGLPFGVTENDSQLDLHLSQHRNSIEAAMLLANFNRIPTTNNTNNMSKQSSNESLKGNNNTLLLLGLNGVALLFLFYFLLKIMRIK
jgi:hypothetical protein